LTISTSGDAGAQRSTARGERIYQTALKIVGLVAAVLGLLSAYLGYVAKTSGEAKQQAQEVATGLATQEHALRGENQRLHTENSQLQTDVDRLDGELTRARANAPAVPATTRIPPDSYFGRPTTFTSSTWATDDRCPAFRSATPVHAFCASGTSGNTFEWTLRDGYAERQLQGDAGVVDVCTSGTYRIRFELDHVEIGSREVTLTTSPIPVLIPLAANGRLLALKIARLDKPTAGSAADYCPIIRDFRMS